MFLSSLWSDLSMYGFFCRTQSQEVCADELYAAMRIKAHFRNALYLSSEQSDLIGVDELLIAEAPAGHLLCLLLHIFSLL